MSFDKDCAGYLIRSLGPKKSRINFFNVKTIVPEKKILTHFFFKFTHFGRHQVTILLNFASSFDNYGAIFKMDSSTPESLLKTQIFDEKGYSSNVKTIRLFFLVFSSVTNLKVQILGENKVLWQGLWNHKIICLGPTGSIQTNISKKAFLTVTKIFWPFFFVLSSVTNHKGTKYTRPQSFLRISLEDLRSFL